MNIDELLDIIQLDKIDVDFYIGKNYKTPWKRVFGGQVLAQALNAAYNEVPADRICHSLHGYFILGGDIEKEIIYQVEQTRDGGSFTTRRVTALQHGKSIFVMAASFQKKQDGFTHQSIMPDVKNHKELKSDIEQAQIIRELAPDYYKQIASRQQEAIAFKPVEGVIPNFSNDGEFVRNIWMGLKQKKELSLALQHQLLAYASDYNLLTSAVMRHAHELVDTKNLFLASLDHAMWFHREFDFNDWLLYSIDSPSASNARGMGHGKIYSENGIHVATVMQEGLIRT